MTPHISLMLCIASYGAPISIVLIPAFAAIIGPIVDPQRLSYLTMKSWSGIGGSALEAITLKIAALTESVIYF